MLSCVIKDLKSKSTLNHTGQRPAALLSTGWNFAVYSTSSYTPIGNVKETQQQFSALYDLVWFGDVLYKLRLPPVLFISFCALNLNCKCQFPVANTSWWSKTLQCQTCAFEYAVRGTLLDIFNVLLVSLHLNIRAQDNRVVAYWYFKYSTTVCKAKKPSLLRSPITSKHLTVFQ